MGIRIGLFLKSYRASRHLTQKEMAAKIGVSRVHYARLERGAFGPSAELLQSISTVIGNNIMDVFKYHNGEALDPVQQELHERILVMTDEERRKALVSLREISWGGVNITV
jgi:transcriptional regulator with XRE-family HTH domain